MFKKIVLGVIGLIVLIIIIAAVSSGGSSTTATKAPTQAPASAPVATSAPTAPTVAPAAVAATWKDIITFEGQSIKDTETFTIPSDEWRIVWETKPGQYGDMNFQIYVYKAGGTTGAAVPVSVAANVIGAGKDTSTVRGKGNFYLSINTSQTYKITVQAKQ